MKETLIEKKNDNFTKPVLSAVDSWVTLPTVEFTEDCWNTVYRGCCIDSTFHAYLVRGDGYGTFWIPKCYVRLVNC
jgi:hypothetical protein